MEPIGAVVRLEDVTVVDMAGREQWEATTVAVRYEGFDEFFDTHYDPIVRALALALGSDDLGRDAASEAFARALQRWRSVSRYANQPGWVYRVGLNWGRSRWRKRRREVVGVVGEHGAQVPVDPVHGDVDLRDALRTLGDDQRAIVVARYYLDWSEREVAEALDIKAGTVKSRLHRALGKLSEALEDPNGTD